jgi:hypothetical protein
VASQESGASRRIAEIIRILEEESVRLGNSQEARWFVMDIRVLPAMARECNSFVHLVFNLPMPQG